MQNPHIAALFELHGKPFGRDILKRKIQLRKSGEIERLKLDENLCEEEIISKNESENANVNANANANANMNGNWNENENEDENVIENEESERTENDILTQHEDGVEGSNN
jgi:hypothetical protein